MKYLLLYSQRYKFNKTIKQKFNLNKEIKKMIAPYNKQVQSFDDKNII